MWNSTMMKPCIAHLNQVMLFFSSFTIPSLSLVSFTPCCFNESFFWHCQVEKKAKKKKKKLYLFHADLKASGYSVSSKVKTNAKEKEKKITESCYCKHNILKELCM